MIKIKYVGKKTRVNSFGVFEPGKIYDVKEDASKELLAVTNLFVKVSEPAKIQKKKPAPAKKKKK